MNFNFSINSHLIDPVINVGHMSAMDVACCQVIITCSVGYILDEVIDPILLFVDLSGQPIQFVTDDMMRLRQCSLQFLRVHLVQ
jgi:hypothetical protein